MQKIAIVGGGLVGSLLAVYLGNRGFEVHVFERRADIRKATIAAGKSINLALSDRGWRGLEGVGIAEEIRKIAIPMYGRRMHDTEGNLSYQPYGKDNQAIYSVSRGELNKKLIEIAGNQANIHLHFDTKCTDVDLEEGILFLENSADGQKSEFKADRIFGTDGAFSALRRRMMMQDRFNYSQNYLLDGYKELTIPPAANGGWQMDKNALHIYPRGKFMLIALPNLDGSFTCTLFFPFEGETSFESIKTEKDLLSFFNKMFPDAVPMMSTLVEDYFSNPTSSLVIVRCAPWNYKGKVLLLGDAAHAIVPFFGQGMNAGFEDCTLLNQMMEGDFDWDNLFEDFARVRKPDTDAISELALHNFIEMRDRVADPLFLLQKQIEARIAQRHPTLWKPLYSMVTFSHTPYSEAMQEGVKQEKLMQKVMNIASIAEIWNTEAGDKLVDALVME